MAAEIFLSPESAQPSLRQEPNGQERLSKQVRLRLLRPDHSLVAMRYNKSGSHPVEAESYTKHAVVRQFSSRSIDLL
jgi:hypothetical protein